MTKQEITQFEIETLELLKEVIDPEIEINIVDLGLIYELYYNGDKNINISDPKEKENFKAYKASGGELSHTQAATIGYKTPQESKDLLARKRSIEDAKSKATRLQAEQSGLGTEFFAGANPNIYKKK